MFSAVSFQIGAKGIIITDSFTADRMISSESISISPSYTAESFCQIRNWI